MCVCVCVPCTNSGPLQSWPTHQGWGLWRQGRGQLPQQDSLNGPSSLLPLFFFSLVSSARVFSSFFFYLNVNFLKKESEITYFGRVFQQINNLSEFRVQVQFIYMCTKSTSTWLMLAFVWLNLRSLACFLFFVLQKCSSYFWNEKKIFSWPHLVKAVW